ncbi:unnamed protein product [Trichobilharzia regenti]|nr:unnamed protein product [Trichobilharzia regenti]
MSGPTDDVIQSTNDDATSSKAFAVSRGYWKDNTSLNLLQSTGGACQVVNLGAGSDTLYLSLKDSEEIPHIYVEVDMKANVLYKAMVLERKKLLKLSGSASILLFLAQQTLHRVSKTPSLSRGSVVHKIKRVHIIGSKTRNEISSSVDVSQEGSHYIFDEGKFHLLSFDLRRPAQEFLDILFSPVDGPGCSKSCPTLFLAECVLVYMPPDISYQLLKSISENFPCASFLHYEQAGIFFYSFILSIYL